jgi:malonyl-CoA/methylmalonyl-CoA synthetase
MKTGDCPPFSEDVAMLCYTSGTTGRPKGAMITHENLISNMEALHEAWQWSDRDVLLHALPLFHIHGLVVALHGALNAGATVIMMESFDAERVSKALEILPCTLFMGVPTQYQRITACWEASGQSPDLSRMRLFVSGSAPLPDDLFTRFRQQTGHTILERYGMTETGMIASNPYDVSSRKAGSVGYPLRSVSLRVMDEKGAQQQDGQVGEVQLKGPNVFKGYWKAPEKTADSFDNGWFKTGDLGYLDPEDGPRLYLKGRAKELIISGGFNVYPREVEEVLLNHPDVEEAAVYGLPDDDLGERVAAAVVLAPAARPTDEELIASLREQLTAHLREQLTAYKCPKEIRFLDRLPRNAMGKVQKHHLPQK